MVSSMPAAAQRPDVGQLAEGANTSGFDLVPFESSFVDQCEALITALPDWFGIPDSNSAYLRDLDRLPSWLACRGRQVLGAATLAQRYPTSFEVHFIAVRPEVHRQGVGRALLEHLETEAANRGGEWLHVKTLAPSHPDPFYARTRKFYDAMGFAPLFESSALWGPANPAVDLVKRL